MDKGIQAGAAEVGNFQVLEWLRERKTYHSWITMEYASKGGHLDILLMEYENSNHWDETVVGNAVTYGYIHILEYAKKFQCGWNMDICSLINEKNRMLD